MPIKKEDPEPSKKSEVTNEQKIFYRIVKENEDKGVFATHTYYASQKDANIVLFLNMKKALALQNDPNRKKEEFPVDDIQHGTNDRGNYWVKYTWVRRAFVTTPTGDIADGFVIER